MSFKFNPTTGQLDIAGVGYQPSLKDLILSAPDKNAVVFFSNFGGCEQRITSIEYTAASVSPTAMATKTFTYSDTSFLYNISSVTWTVTP